MEWARVNLFLTRNLEDVKMTAHDPRQTTQAESDIPQPASIPATLVNQTEQSENLSLESAELPVRPRLVMDPGPIRNLDSISL